VKITASKRSQYTDYQYNLILSYSPFYPIFARFWSGSTLLVHFEIRITSLPLQSKESIDNQLLADLLGLSTTFGIKPIDNGKIRK
jgi:hypothetical protein